MARSKHQPDYKRSERINRSIREELSEVLLREVHDPRVRDLTITEVETTEDLRHAKIWYCIRETDQARRTETQTALDRMSGFLRSFLSEAIRLKKAPELHFHLDTSLDYGARIEETIRQIRKEKRSDEAESDPETDR